MDLILFGPPGAGKGTQGELLARRFRLKRLSTGDMLRDALHAGTPLGLEAKKFMNAGELVPDDVILGMVGEALQQDGARSGVLFDGFPRTIAQAVRLDALLRDLGRPLGTVLVLDVDDETLVKRLSGRYSCPRCGAVYNQYFNPPSAAGVCGECGGALIQRADDAPETVRRRLEVYRAQTKPLIAFYEASPTPVQFVDGDREVGDVQEDLVKILTH
jgi:adenylate kinase